MVIVVQIHHRIRWHQLVQTIMVTVVVEMVLEMAVVVARTSRHTVRAARRVVHLCASARRASPDNTASRAIHACLIHARMAPSAFLRDPHSCVSVRLAIQDNGSSQMYFFHKYLSHTFRIKENSF